MNYFSACPVHEDILPLLVEYAQESFRSKKLENEYIIELKERFTFSEEPLARSILKMNNNDNKTAVEIYNLFLKYLPSRRVKHVSDAVKLATSPVLQNELYCQAIRHTLSNSDLYV